MPQWNPPFESHVKLNVDEAVSFQGKSVIRELIQDGNGFYLGGFVRWFGSASFKTTEILAILHGINYVWDRGWRRVVVESD